MEKYNPTGLTHEIRTIEQFASLVTKENLPFIIKDFQSSLEMLLDFDELNKLSCRSHNFDYEKLEMEVFNWIDDGLHLVPEITIQAKDDPEVKFHIKAKDKE